MMVQYGNDAQFTEWPGLGSFFEFGPCARRPSGHPPRRPPLTVPHTPSPQPFRPLAIGSPRSGFTLLCSILGDLVPLAPTKIDLRQRILNAVIDAFGNHVANTIANAFADAGIEDDLVFNANFRELVGGPKWLSTEDDWTACVRKYIGVRGLGDFTLVTRHPLQVLDHDPVVHSHTDPGRWLVHPAYRDYHKFASVRDPVGIVNSALFSINALTSEYIQRFVPPDTDTDKLRQHLALYKYTDLDFFTGLATFYRRYFTEFMKIRSDYVVMRWEDLIAEPTKTVAAVAADAGFPIREAHAADIWSRIDHVNLTGAHQHNFRPGGGKVGDWRNWITNRHLDILREMGFDDVRQDLGYGPIPRLDEGAYTPFQRTVDDLMARGDVFRDFADDDLFGFAFNKSNLDSSKFQFERYDWRRATRVERSAFKDQALLFKVWERADDAVVELNTVADAVLAGRYASEDDALASLRAIGDAAPSFATAMPRAHQALFPALDGIVRAAFESQRQGVVQGFDDGLPPRLLHAYRNYNLVSFRGWFYGIPQALGPIDLESATADDLAGIIRKPTFKEAQDAIDRVASDSA